MNRPCQPGNPARDTPPRSRCMQQRQNCTSEVCEPWSRIGLEAGPARPSPLDHRRNGPFRRCRCDNARAVQANTVPEPDIPVQVGPSQQCGSRYGAPVLQANVDKPLREGCHWPWTRSLMSSQACALLAWVFLGPQLRTPGAPSQQRPSPCVPSASRAQCRRPRTTTLPGRRGMRDQDGPIGTGCLFSARQLRRGARTDGRDEKANALPE
jgi:hypothetical protein